jgi:hypothetical protein
VKFLNLFQIIFYVDTFNGAKRNTTKNILFYNKNINELILIENNAELEDFILKSRLEAKKECSQYNYLLNDVIFTSSLALIDPSINEELEKQNMNMNFELRCIEEKIQFYQSLRMKDGFLTFFKNYLILLIKYQLYYKISDVFMYYFNFNEKASFLFIVKI